MKANKINRLTLLFMVTSVVLIQCKQPGESKNETINVLSFNVLQGGHDASNVGFPDNRFNGSRFDDLVWIITEVAPDIVGVQEDSSTDSLLMALGESWNRCYNIYSKFELKPLESNGHLLNACRVYLPGGDSLVLVNCHWWPAGGYGPGIIKNRILEGSVPSDLNVFEDEVLEKTKKIAEGPRGYLATVNMVKPYLEANEKVILVGDFNEPSHLDWTERYAKEGADRMVKNPTNIPLRFAIGWKGSKALEKAGLADAYRTFNNDEVKKPGITWTPPYPNGTPGRQDYDNQELVRIDRIYYTGKKLKCINSSVVTGSVGNGEIKLDCDWPSDHWAVSARFEIIVN
ncbi:MAG: endonuclease/exonuclease/phosphatase family protein [Bacteroidota bacterium]